MTVVLHSFIYTKPPGFFFLVLLCFSPWVISVAYRFFSPLFYMKLNLANKKKKNTHAAREKTFNIIIIMWGQSYRFNRFRSYINGSCPRIRRPKLIGVRVLGDFSAKRRSLRNGNSNVVTNNVYAKEAFQSFGQSLQLNKYTRQALGVTHCET